MQDNPREAFENLRSGKTTETLINEWAPFALVMSDPVNTYLRANRQRGKVTYDPFGAAFIWPEDQISGMPHVTENNKVIPDITRWREFLHVPDLLLNCTDWTQALQEKQEIDAQRQLVMGFMACGVFEQLHALMGFEDTLANMLLEPESMLELCEVIGDFRLTFAKLLVENLKPDAILSHDDWGSKKSLFMSPESFRTFLKPQYQKLYGYLKEQGILVMHHADSFCEPLIEDMVELGIDIWQGVLPENDIVSLQSALDGRMLLMGGIDASIVDREDSTEEEIRREVRRACAQYGPGGGFIPSMTYGGPDSCLYPHVNPYVTDEINCYNRDLPTYG